MIYGHVYFIDDDQGKTKIGWTTRDPIDRMKKLQIPNLNIKFVFATKYHPVKLEGALHFKYKEYSKGREWFDLNNFTKDELFKVCEQLNLGLESIHLESDDFMI